MIEGSEITIWVVIVLVVLFLVLAVIYILSREVPPPSLNPNDPSESPPLSPPDPVGLSYYCTKDGDCLDSVCDLITNTCRLPEGRVCLNGFDCTSGTYCSGTCVNSNILPNKTTGVVGDPCPCRNGFNCVIDPSDPKLERKICLRDEGSSCSTDSDCISGKCSSGVCAPGLDDLDPCRTDSQCLSKNCSNGVCQPRNTTTGELGSLCQPSNNLKCNDGLICSTGGVCVLSTSGLLQPCDNTSVGCSSYLGCYRLPKVNADGGYSNPGSIDGFGGCGVGDLDCVCLFNTDENTAEPEPNAPSPSGVCPEGSTLSGTSCKWNAQQPCFLNSQCLSGSCSSTQRYFYRLDFGSPPSISISTGAIGTTQPEFVKFASDFSTPRTPMKLIGTTVNNKDILYGVYYRGRNIQIGESTVVLAQIVEGQSPKPIITGSTVVDTLGRTVIFTDADVATFNNRDVLLMTGTVQGTQDDVILSYEFDTLGNVFWDPYTSPDGRQQDNRGKHISFSYISMTDVQTDPNYPGILVWELSGSSIKMNFNLGVGIFVDVSDRLKGSTNPTDISLVYGLSQDEGGNSFSYPVISYVSGPTQNRFLRFSNGLDAQGTTTFSFIKYPTPLYGRPGGLIPTVTSGGISKNNPLLNGYQNGLLVEGNNLYSISSGSVSAIPGYFDSSARILVTSLNFYIYNKFSC